MTIAHETVLRQSHEEPHSLEYSTSGGRLKILGFWMFLATDLVLFGCLFATYLVVRTHAATGPTEGQLFDVPTFTAETLILLTSSFTCGLGTREMRRGSRGGAVSLLIITVLLGLSFVGLEVNEFVKYTSSGANVQTSAFLSAFFVLVGTHGCHVSMGILWMTSILLQLMVKGISQVTAPKVFVVGLYWHFLDVVWVYIYTVVYLMGVIK